MTGIVRDEMNGIFLPGVPVEVVTGGDVVYTDVDGRFLVQVPRGAHQIRVALEGYEERTISVHLHDLRGSRPQ